MSEVWRLQAYVYGAQAGNGAAGPLATTLDDVANWLERTGSIHFEWDGSFVGAGPEGYQFSGTLFDKGSQIQYVELHARCDSFEARRSLHRTLGAVLWRLAAAASDEPAASLIHWKLLDERLSLMRLPDRRWQSLQQLETELLGSDS